MTIGVDLTLDERWEQGKPECGEDFCDMCFSCLGCDGEGPCRDYLNDKVYEHHMWANSADEVRLI